MVRKSCYHVARIRDLYPSLDCLKVVFACETKLLHNAKCTTANVNKIVLNSFGMEKKASNHQQKQRNN